MDKYMKEMVTKIFININNIFMEGDDVNLVAPVKEEEINENFFTAELMALKLQFEKLTEQEVDLIEFTHILNRLAVQYLLENNATLE